MALHKHGSFSFIIQIQRMVVVGGNNFVADLVALRRHRPSGAADDLDVPMLPEAYGETAPEAEAQLAASVRAWLNADRSNPLEPLQFENTAL